MNNKKKILNIALATGFISSIPFNTFAENAESLLNIDWSSEFGEGGFENFESIIKTKDGGFVVVGEADINEVPGGSRGDAFIIKYDKDGKQEWYNAVIGDDTDLFYNVVETKDGGFYAIGKSFSSDVGFENVDNMSNAIIAKYDNEGNQVGINAISDSGKQINYIDIAINANDKLVVVGDKVIDGERTGFIAFLNENGDEEKIVTIKNNNRSTKIKDFVQTKDGDFVIVGNAIVKDGISVGKDKEVPFVTCLDREGQEKWSYVIENDKDEKVKILDGSFKNIVETEDGKFIAVGYSGVEDKDSLIMSFDKSGNKEWYDVIRGESSDIYNSVMVNSQKEIIVVGESSPNKDVDLLKDLNISVTRYTDKGQKIRTDNLGGQVTNIATSKAIMTTDDNIVAVGKSYKKVEGADVKCEITRDNSLDKCIQADGIIMKIAVNNPVVSPEEDEVPPNPCEVNEKPEIKAEDVTIYVGEEFKVFLGVTAVDKENGDITKTITVTYNNVDNTKAGEYKVLYKVVDECGATVEKERKVIVKEKPINKVENGNTDKPQTGDAGFMYVGMSALASLGLISVNRKKED